MPKFYCSNCGQHIDADESLAGTIAACPSCHIQLYVPEEHRDKSIPKQINIAGRTFPVMKSQPEIIPLFKEKLLSWGPHILNIPDEKTKICLLSVFYYLGEFSYGNRNVWFVPERFLAGNPSESMEHYSEITDVFYAGTKEIINNLYHYTATKQEGFLQNLRDLAPEVLYHCNFPVVHALESYV